MLPMNIDMMLAAESNVKSLSKLFDRGLEPVAVPLGSYDEGELANPLVHCDLFKDTDMRDITRSVQRICECVPVGFLDLEGTLHFLLQSLRPETVQAIENEM